MYYILKATEADSETTEQAMYKTINVINKMNEEIH